MAAPTGFLQLYKTLLRESQKFSHYSYREHAVRRIRETFREHIQESNGDKIKDLMLAAEHNLQTIKRQVIINQLYQGKQLVIENPVISASVKPSPKPTPSHEPTNILTG